MNRASLLLLWSTLVLAGSAAAQGSTVYRCGSDGRQFSDRPCAGGELLDVAQEPRPAADLADAQRRARRELQQAEAIHAQAAHAARSPAPAGFSGSRLRLARDEPIAPRARSSRLGAEDARRPAAPAAPEPPLRQARSPQRLAAAGTSP